eukprot:6535523-Heterocapsa_arctica.AAC.1
MSSTFSCGTRSYVWNSLSEPLSFCIAIFTFSVSNNSPVKSSCHGRPSLLLDVRDIILALHVHIHAVEHASLKLLLGAE